LDYALEQYLVPHECHLVLRGERTELANLPARIDVAVLGEIAHPCEITLHLGRVGATFLAGDRHGAERRHPRPVRLQRKWSISGVERERDNVGLTLLDRRHGHRQLVYGPRRLIWVEPCLGHHRLVVPET